MQPQIIPSRSILSSTQSALLIPLEHLSWLLKLLYFLPKTLMQQHRFAMDQTHIFVIAEEDVSGLPLGIPYHQASRNVFIPLGFDLKPEMSPEVWSAFFQTTDQTAVFFIADEGSVGSNKRLDGRFKRVDMSHFQPLSRSHLATPAEQLEWMDVDTVESSVLSPAPEVIEGELSVFSLWRGDRDASEIKSTSRLLSNHSSSLSSKTPSQDGEP